MKGYRRHIAASAAITAVFVVCALMLAFTAFPGDSTVGEEGAVASVKACATYEIIQGSGSAPEADAVEAPGAAPAPEATPQASVPAPPPAAPPAPQVPEESSDVGAARPPGPDPQPVINPPTDLEGSFVAEIPPYVFLTWNPNNHKRYISHYRVYRALVEGGEPGPVAFIGENKKAEFEDYTIETGETYRYWVSVVSKWGEESEPSEPVDVETYSPTPPAPPQGVVAVAIDPGVSIDWQPNTEPNLAGYNVYVYKGVKWRLLNRDVLTEPHYYHSDGGLADTYAVSAVNIYGIESGYTVVQPQPSTPVIYEESDPSITVEGLWVIERYTGPTDGKIRVAEDAGARLHFRFTGRQVKMINAVYWSCGAARIYIDGRLVDTINMYSQTTAYQVTDFDAPGLAYGEHVLTVEVLGSGNPVEPYNFVNVDAFEVR